VCIGSKHTVVTTSTPTVTRLSPRNGFNGFLRALPGDEFLFVTVIGGLTICETRLDQQNLRRFDISNGCQDHTTSPYAPSAFAKRLRRVWYPPAEALAKTKNSIVRPRAGSSLTDLVDPPRNRRLRANAAASTASPAQRS
jgi:hypothetical protein